MKLSASLYSNKKKSIEESVRELEVYGIDYWHIDSIENRDVFQDISKINNISQIPVDLHIISRHPETFFDDIESLDIDRVSFQMEELPSAFQFPKFDSTKVGLAITIDNPEISQKISQYESQIDFVLLMMTTPGISGGTFENRHFAVIHRLVSDYPHMKWCVDGGVNHEISYILKLIGIQSVVIGSYLMNHENMAQAILQIRAHHVKSAFHVCDFMIPTSNLPIISQEEPILSMMGKMDKFKLGIVFCVDANNKLLGVISNADIRKILLTGHFSYDMPISSFLNTSPKTIYSHQSTAEMIEFIERIEFPILVLPIIEKNGTLKGAISFHKLLKEE